MKWSRPVGLLLLTTTLYLAQSMPIETTTTPRYTSFEGYSRFSLNATKNSANNISANLSRDITNISSHFPVESTINNLSDRSRISKQLKGPLANTLQPNNNNNNNNIEIGRKLNLKPSNNHTLYTNFIKTTFNNLTGIKTFKISTVNKVSTKVNKQTNRVTAKPILHTSNTRVPDSKNSSVSSVTIHDKNHVNIISSTARSVPKIKYKVTTSRPIVIKLTRSTTKQPKITTPRYLSKQTRKPHVPKAKNKTISNLSKERPVVHKIITKWSDTADLSEVKQNWYEEEVPYPNPNPEISSFSPPVLLSDISSISPIVNDFSENINRPSPNPEITSYSPSFSLGELSPVSSVSSEFIENADFSDLTPEVSSYSPSYSISGVSPILPDTPDISDVPASASTGVVNPISTFNLDMVPDGTKQLSDSTGSPCPTVHISSSVLAPRQMECSDLNLVINSHFHQNQNGGGTRNPSISTYDAAGDAAIDPVQADAPLEEAVVDSGVANSAGTLADPGQGAAQAAAPQPSPAAAPSGGTGGSGGSGGSGDNGGLKFPDLTNLFKSMGYLWNVLSYLLSFLRNPYLYIIPMALFFALAFFTVLALFPWWIPLLLLYLSVKTHKQPKETISFYNHIHKPIHHPDGWFWNHQTKTWQNVEEIIHKQNNHGYKRGDNIEGIIKDIKRKYGDNKFNSQTWKRRRRPK